jgi:predicted nuclease of restriction endonuclease-like (RecB) superfamily
MNLAITIQLRMVKGLRIEKNFHRVLDLISTKRENIVKYRPSMIKTKEILESTIVSHVNEAMGLHRVIMIKKYQEEETDQEKDQEKETEFISMKETYRFIINQKVIDIQNDLFGINFVFRHSSVFIYFFVTVPIINQPIISES